MNDLIKSNSFQRLENEITGLASLYFKALDLNRKKTNSNHMRLISTIRQAYESLNSEERRIINNEFFYQKYASWWKDSYTLNYYKKLKLKSMEHFLEVFYETAI